MKRPCLALISWLCWLSAACCGAEQRVVVAGTAQEFADAVRSLKEGEDLVVQLNANTVINMSDPVVLGPITPEVSSGSLTIRGQVPRDGSQQMALLDLGWRSAVATPLGGLARLNVEHVLVTGRCHRYVMYNPVYSIGWYSSSSYYFFPAPLPSSGTAFIQRTRETGATWHLGANEAAVYTYGQPLADASDFAEFNVHWATWSGLASSSPVIVDISESGMVAAAYSAPSSLWTDFTLAIAGAPGDPVAARAGPGYQFLPRLCNSSAGGGRLLHPSEFAVVNTSASPLWVVETSPHLEAALGGMERAQADPSLSLPRGLQGYPVVLVLDGNVTLAPRYSGGVSAPAGTTGGSQPYVLAGTTLMSGPLNHIAAAVRHVTLDLGGATTPLLNLPPPTPAFTPRLIAHKLELGGLSPGWLAGAETAMGPGTLNTSALPLWAFGRANITAVGPQVAGGPQLKLHNATLHLPAPDFYALLAAALRGRAWKSGARATAPLLYGLTVFDVGLGLLGNTPIVTAAGTQATVNLTAASRSLYIERLEGWGMSGEHLVLAPDVQLPRCAPAQPQWDLPAAPCQGSEDAGDGSHGRGPHDRGDQAVKVGVGVGVGVGGALLVAGVVALVVMVIRRSRAANLMTPAAVDAASGSKSPAVASEAAIHVIVDSKGGSRENGVSLDISALAMGSFDSRMGAARQEDADGRLAELAAAAGVGAAELDGALTGAAVSLRSAGALVGGGSPPGGGNGVDSSGGPASGVPDAVMQAMIAARVLANPSEVVEAAAAELWGNGTRGGAEADKLTLTGVLGKGAWGTVYLGTWRGLPVAVKTLVFMPTSTFARGGPMPYERAVTEAAVATSMVHRNVVATYRYDIKEAATRQEAGQSLEVDAKAGTGEAVVYKLFLIQECCNTSLRAACYAHVLHKVGPDGAMRPHPALVLVLLIDVATGLVALHTRNIVHGDLKTDNVLLKNDKRCAAGVVAKLTDFGLSEALDPGATHVSNFKSGTPFYVAPEVLATARLTKASDMYSLGIVMWEVWQNSPPWVSSPDGSFAPNPGFLTPPPHCAPALPATMAGANTVPSTATQLPAASRCSTDAPPCEGPAAHSHHAALHPPAGSPAAVDCSVWALVRACMAADAAARPTAEQVRAELIGVLATLGITLSEPAVPAGIEEL